MEGILPANAIRLMPIPRKVYQMLAKNVVAIELIIKVYAIHHVLEVIQ
jgi:hypothetical protein